MTVNVGGGSILGTTRKTLTPLVYISVLWVPPLDDSLRRQENVVIRPSLQKVTHRSYGI